MFSLNPATGAEKVLHSFTGANGGSDGAVPIAALVSLGGKLYGTTQLGSTNYGGTVFSINPATGAEQILYSFAGGNDGSFPDASLINVGGTFYGTTFNGGASFGVSIR